MGIFFEVLIKTSKREEEDESSVHRDNKSHRFATDDTGTVMRMSDHMGSGRWCRVRAVNLEYDLPQIDFLEWLAAEAFPGTFSWRLVHFPMASIALSSADLYMRWGTCTQIIFAADPSNPTVVDAQLVDMLRQATYVVGSGLEGQVAHRIIQMKLGLL